MYGILRPYPGSRLFSDSMVTYNFWSSRGEKNKIKAMWEWKKIIKVTKAGSPWTSVGRIPSRDTKIPIVSIILSNVFFRRGQLTEKTLTYHRPVKTHPSHLNIPYVAPLTHRHSSKLFSINFFFLFRTTQFYWEIAFLKHFSFSIIVQFFKIFFSHFHSVHVLNPTHFLVTWNARKIDLLARLPLWKIPLVREKRLSLRPEKFRPSLYFSVARNRDFIWLLRLKFFEVQFFFLSL